MKKKRVELGEHAPPSKGATAGGTPPAKPSPSALSDVENQWTYTPIPGYQFAVNVESELDGMMLIASRIKPGREEKARRVLTLATAAPDLYAALKLAINTVECASIDIQEGPTKGQELPWYRTARAALAKARGETDAG